MFNLGFSFGQTDTSLSSKNKNLLSGQVDFFVKCHIENYANQAVYVYKCYQDTLLFIDSAKTDKNGKLVFHKYSARGIYRFNMMNNQFFFLINDGKAARSELTEPARSKLVEPVEIKTTYQFNAFNNIATDSLKVLKSEENKLFNRFQQLQKKNVIANAFLKEMMRLYPLGDSFHPTIEKEWAVRYKEMDHFVKTLHTSTSLSTSATSQTKKIALAYFQPVNPDWKQPDPWRDSIIAAHYFDYFDPADSFYLHTNILPEKIDMYLYLCTNKRDAYGQPVSDEKLISDAAISFINKTKPNKITYNFCLNYLMKRISKEHKEIAFLALYDYYFKTKDDDCGEADSKEFAWVRKKADAIRGVQIDQAAPDFYFYNQALKLSSMQSDYTLIVFWASWCQHCVNEMPEVIRIIEEFKKSNPGKTLLPVFVSLDKDETIWKNFVENNNLNQYIHLCDFKGWSGDIA
ncbi:MAG: hypothetical protein A2275_03200, partial [Bacteroidetes bacterium RIFOXYA12_FULL_35_11]